MALLSATMLCLESHSVSALLLFYYDCYAVTLHKPRRRAAKAESFLLSYSAERRSESLFHSWSCSCSNRAGGPIKMDPLPKWLHFKTLLSYLKLLRPFKLYSSLGRSVTVLIPFGTYPFLREIYLFILFNDVPYKRHLLVLHLWLSNVDKVSPTCIISGMVAWVENLRETREARDILRQSIIIVMIYKSNYHYVRLATVFT